jgi:hypothetical protein
MPTSDPFKKKALVIGLPTIGRAVNGKGQMFEYYMTER